MRTEEQVKGRKVFDNIYEAKKWFRSYKEYTENETDPFFTYDYDSNDWLMGDWFLFCHVDMNREPIIISRPIFALFVGFDMWDMALVVEFVEQRRAWGKKTYYTTTGESGDKYYWSINSERSEIESIPLWFDNILVLGHWKNKPTISEIKKAIKEPEYKKFNKTP